MRLADLTIVVSLRYEHVTKSSSEVVAILFAVHPAYALLRPRVAFKEKYRKLQECMIQACYT
jgi:hypothetical protein